MAPFDSAHTAMHTQYHRNHLRFFLLLLTCVSIFNLFLPGNSPCADSAPLAADLVTEGQPIDVSSRAYQELFEDLRTQHRYTQPELDILFENLHVDRKVLQLMDRQGESKPYYQYRSLFITPMIIIIGKQQLSTYKQLFDRIENEFQVDREVIVAIWAIESRFGANQGGFNLFQTLNTLFAAYPRRSLFYRQELIHFLTLCRENGLDPLSIKGSYAGAFGQAQFMPSSFNKYAVDFDGDKHPDLINSPPDIFASIANYLKKFGWIFKTPVYAELGRELRSDILVDIYHGGRKELIDWQQLTLLQNVSLAQPANNGRFSIIGLETSPQDGGGMRFVAGYPNLQAIHEYNHSSKYAMAVAEMIDAFKN